jgi:transposase-like protein
MIIRDVCPQCQSPKFKKNGHIHNGKQNHHCHDCGRQFVQCYEQYLIAEDKRHLIERLLLEGVPAVTEQKTTHQAQWGMAVPCVACSDSALF